MKILIIDNGSSFLKKLKSNLSKYTVKVRRFDKVNLKEANEYDKIILSGGHKLGIIKHPREFKNEIKIIKDYEKPILGVCLGFELIIYANNEKLEKLEEKKKGLIEIKQTRKDKILKGINKNFKAYESHRWIVKKVKNLRELARSEKGVEIIKHPTKEIYGTQFHPEAFKNKKHGLNIIKNFLKI